MSDFTVSGDTLDEVLDYIIDRFATILGYREIYWAVAPADLPDIETPVFYLDGTTQLNRQYNSGYQVDCTDRVRINLLYQIKNRKPVEARKAIIEECSKIETEFIKNSRSDNFTFVNFSKDIKVHSEGYFLVTIELDINYERSL